MTIFWKLVEVTCMHVRNYRTGSDPGCCLELYGELSASDCYFDVNGKEKCTGLDETFWKRKSSNAIELSPGAVELINKKKTFALFPGHHITFGGFMLDEDQDFLNADDLLGPNYNRFNYDHFNVFNAPETHVVTFYDLRVGLHDQVAEAAWRLELVTLAPIPGT